ncbi:MAG: RNA ligase family protein [Candidatus Sabulitectum sp.]|nr:RNA ligase family protein [Candidatus Sabulitectum sp.]
MNDFFKYPRTPHLAVLGNNSFRDDKVMSEHECELFLKHHITVEEKIDGANLGISFDSFGGIKLQNRGKLLVLPYIGQWKKLSDWLMLKTDLLYDLLSDEYILFGEWCYAQHSINYTNLPDWFLGFDVYDKRCNKFLSVKRRNDFLKNSCINMVPMIQKGIFSLDECKELIGISHFGDCPSEGIYLRYDEGDFLGKRAKLVNASFLQSIGSHWSCRGIRANQLKSGVWA